MTLLHNKSAERRKNNIYGELDDVVVIKFLNLGGDGAIYNSGNHRVPTFFGRAPTQSYVVQMLADPEKFPEKPELINIAAVLGHVPIYGTIVHGKVKFFNINGEKITHLK